MSLMESPSFAPSRCISSRSRWGNRTNRAASRIPFAAFFPRVIGRRIRGTADHGIPFKPWARALYDYRQATFTKDDPHTRCKPSGGARLFHTPYGFEILQLADTKEIMFLPVGSPHSWRVVHMDGRPLPENPPPSWYGTSVGRWEGDTLVIDTVGFNERFWISREGVPHTAQLRTTERISRPRFRNAR